MIWRMSTRLKAQILIASTSERFFGSVPIIIKYLRPQWDFWRSLWLSWSVLKSVYGCWKACIPWVKTGCFERISLYVKANWNEDYHVEISWDIIFDSARRLRDLASARLSHVFNVTLVALSIWISIFEYNSIATQLRCWACWEWKLI